MSLSCMSYYWNRKDELSTTEAMVLLALADNANDAGESWPSHRTLAGKSRMSVSGVRKVIDRLVELGEITVERRERKDGSTTSNLHLLVGYRKSGTPAVHPKTDDPTGQGGATSGQGGATSGQGGAPTVAPVNSHITTTTTPSATGQAEAHGSIQAMVMAYFEGLKKCGKVVDTKKFPRYVRAAKAGLELGFTPEQVMASTIELSRQPFWSDKMVPLEKVVERLQAKPVTIRKPATQPAEPTNYIDPFRF